jgi:hypothetical protein
MEIDISALELLPAEEATGLLMCAGTCLGETCTVTCGDTCRSTDF